MEKIRSAGFQKVLIVAIFMVGIVLRIAFYLKNPSLWVDEASLVSNILEKSYIELFKGLDYLQVSPPGFTVLVKSLTVFISPESLYAKDLVLRFLPFISGILAIPVFYSLLKLVFENNKTALIWAFALFVFNPATIVYSTQLKQYSTELLISVVLLWSFCKIIKSAQARFVDMVLMFIAPWFSYSSFFILVAGLICVFLKKRKEFLKISFFVFLSGVIFYIVSLKSVWNTNYSGMDLYWNNYYAFWEFQHPTRIFYRLGDIFTQEKLLSFCIGSGIIFSYFKYCFSKEDILKKILILSPLSMVIIFSYFHLYPMNARLMLFLLPTLVILLAWSKDNIYQVLKMLILIVSLCSIVLYSPEANSMSYSYARELLESLNNEINLEDSIIIEAPVYSNSKLMYTEYDYYIKQLDLKNKVLKIPLSCRGETLLVCKEKLESLDQGSYYLLSTATLDKDFLKLKDFRVRNVDYNSDKKFNKALFLNK